MKPLFAVALGILTAIGGFLDIGDLVTNAVVGSRLGWRWLGWCRSACWASACSPLDVRAGRGGQRPGHLRTHPERLGPRSAAANLAASFFINPMTLTAEIGGVALALELAIDVGPMMWIPVAAFAVWLVVWRVKFSPGERHRTTRAVPDRVCSQCLCAASELAGLDSSGQRAMIRESESAATYWYFAIALFGAAMTPYEVFFFSSGAVEEHWTIKDLGKSRLNVVVGFPLGGILSVAIAACATMVLLPHQIEVTSLSQTVMPVVAAGGKLALAFAIVGIVAATFGAALETTLSSGYILAQFLGRTWGKFRRPAEAARFHVVMFVAVVAGAAVLFTGVDPIMVTEYSVVFSAIALPLTYLPILIVANDPQYLGDETNGRWTNMLGSVYLVIILAASLAAIPLMIVTGAGQ